MYGLLIENTIEFIKDRYGEDAWLIIREKSRIHEYAYVSHRMYSERIIARLSQAVSEYTGCTAQEFMEATGIEFVKFLGKYGYDRMLRVLGRSMRDFLNGLDNLHEYLRFSYPKMKPPSFFCTDESATGLTLHYRSRRTGYLRYVKGQLRQVGKQFYNLDVKVDVVSEETRGDTTYVVFKLEFDNKEFESRSKNVSTMGDEAVVQANIFFDLFPFHIVFDKNMTVKNVGKSLQAIIPDIVGKNITNSFELKRPMLNFTFDNIRAHENNVFEIVSTSMIVRTMSTNTPHMIPEDEEIQPVSDLTNIPEDDEEYKDSRHSLCGDDANEIIAEDFHPRRLRLKGQMKHVPEWDAYIFLATPFMPNLDAMFQTGLYINDLSMHDSSRDLVLAGTQQSAELKLALDQELQKSAQLEQSMRKLDQEMKRTDSLLYQMIPKAVADKLRRGEPATSTCEVFKDVTILFSDVVGFTEICSRIEPMQVVAMLNGMYTKFDQLSEAHEVYKVETIGDAYMIMSGAPVMTKYHAVRVAEMAMAMKRDISLLRDPSTGTPLQIRIGMHSGMVVAGVVGLKMPRYCLFGDTVNTASRMESTGQAMRIHLSEGTRQYLREWPFYILQERAVKCEVKGKGMMKTYFLMGKEAVDESELPFTIRGSAENASRSSLNSSMESLRSFSGVLTASMPHPDVSTMSRGGVIDGGLPRRGSLTYTPVGLETDRSVTPVNQVHSPNTLEAPKSHSSRLKTNTALNVNNSRGSSDVIHDIPSFKIKDDTKGPIEGKVNNNLFEGVRKHDATGVEMKPANEMGGEGVDDLKSNVKRGNMSTDPHVSGSSNSNVPHSTTCVII
ncbi:soluble guanylate cyclase 88E-like isoform X1 [Asterias amurensis]|uniref:soluble guanylate cyclase 88E-like isoform X1 n=1 Tax=Asterias amurensis TaxID=7602 RepID=UPI003AB72F78